MLAYVLRRVGLAVPILFGVCVITFLIMNWVPGNPVVVMMEKRADPETVARLTRQLGLDDPLPVQFGRFMAGVVRGDLGKSFRTQEPVMGTILERFPTTLTLTLTSMAVGIILGATLGVLAAVYQNTWVDHAGMTLALLGISVPVFWVAIVLQLYFGLYWGLLPISGYDGWRYMILPAMALGTRYSASIARMTRSSMLEVIRQDYVRTARAKGLAGGRVVLRHGLRNALIPVVTLLGLEFGGLLAGSILTESVFGIPGLGRLGYEAIQWRDYTLIQGTVLFTAFVFVALNLAVDVSYAFLDPRIRYDTGG